MNSTVSVILLGAAAWSLAGLVVAFLWADRRELWCVRTDAAAAKARPRSTWRGVVARGLVWAIAWPCCLLLRGRLSV